jgi:flagellar hook-associated protein 3 FlgL
MIRGVDSSTERFLSSLQRNQERSARAQRQITSGYRVEKPSDAPGDLPNIVGLQSRLVSVTQCLANLNLAKSEVDRNEAVLRQAVQIVQDLTVAAVQGVNATAGPEERALVAARIREWHSGLVRIANQDYNGRYDFGGDRDDVAPYAVDWQQPGGVVRAHNQPDTRQIEDAAGNRYSISRRAQDIFDLRDSADNAASGNVFHAVHAVATALEANDPGAAMDAIGQLKAAAGHLNHQLSAYGSLQNRVRDSIDQAKQAELRATARLAELRESDLPAAALELAQANTGLEAALNAQARVSRRTLFDYLG